MRIDVQVSIEDEITGSNVQVNEVAQFSEIDDVRETARTAVERILAAASIKA